MKRYACMRGEMCVDGLEVDDAEALCDVAGHCRALQSRYLVRERPNSRSKTVEVE